MEEWVEKEWTEEEWAEWKESQKQKKKWKEWVKPDDVPPVLHKDWPFEDWPKFYKGLKWSPELRDLYEHWVSTRKPFSEYSEDATDLETHGFIVLVHFRPDQINVSNGKFSCLHVEFDQVLVKDDHWEDSKENFHISLVQRTGSDEYTCMSDADKQFLVTHFASPVWCTFKVHVSTGGCIFLDDSKNPTMKEFLEVVQRSNNRGAHISLD